LRNNKRRTTLVSRRDKQKKKVWGTAQKSVEKDLERRAITGGTEKKLDKYKQRDAGTCGDSVTGRTRKKRVKKKWKAQSF